jgi:hypothetical protein
VTEEEEEKERMVDLGSHEDGNGSWDIFEKKRR